MDKFEESKITSSGISEASKIAVIEVEFESSNKVIDYLSSQEERNTETFVDKIMTSENHDSWFELNRIKSIICEFIQFFNFNLHLNYLTHDYEFSFSDKPCLIGFTTVTEEDRYYYETDKIDFFGHYVLYEKEKDNLQELMLTTSKIWHKDNPSIHFFLDALKGNNITATNFIKLVFTLESFFRENTSTLFMKTSIPILISDNKKEMEKIEQDLTFAFAYRNEIVHGGQIHNISRTSTFKRKGKPINTSELFFDLKNIIIKIFYFYLNSGYYNDTKIIKIDQKLLFSVFSNKELKIKKIEKELTSLSRWVEKNKSQRTT